VAGVEVRASARAVAAVLGTLGSDFVLRLKPPPRNAGLSDWTNVAMPDGRTGYIAPGGLLSLAAARLCYAEDTIAGWRIAGYVAAGQ
jgi:hypothetical protein